MTNGASFGKNQIYKLRHRFFIYLDICSRVKKIQGEIFDLNLKSQG